MLLCQVKVDDGDWAAVDVTTGEADVEFSVSLPEVVVGDHSASFRASLSGADDFGLACDVPSCDIEVVPTHTPASPPGYINITITP